MRKSEFYKNFSSYDGTDGDWHLKHMLDILSFVVNKLPEDGTIVPKHRVFGTYY